MRKIYIIDYSLICKVTNDEKHKLKKKINIILRNCKDSYNFDFIKESIFGKNIKSTKWLFRKWCWIWWNFIIFNEFKDNCSFHTNSICNIFWKREIIWLHLAFRSPSLNSRGELRKTLFCIIKVNTCICYALSIL